ncbi:siderophore ABC transporter substrate-binding protein [Paenibacillus sp. MBLB4367]|uniref:siderophore ABC transporter substrate-binding protein n=1 Tax=Paenibacillus sp. MBLB4367 TaxID=3384767 RepID=UPI003907F28C
MKKKLMLPVLTLIVALATSACGAGKSETPASNAAGSPSPSAAASTAPSQAPAEVTIKHKLGETKVKTNPKNVVVFDFGILDSLDKLGVEVTGVPQANIPPYLSKYKESKYKNTGSLTEPDFEKINALKPELIIISGRQQTAYDELKKIAPTVFLGVDTTKYMDSYTENTKILGTIFGKEKAVEEELAKVSASVKSLSDKVKAMNKNALIVLANEGSLSAYGAGSRFGIIHDVIGFKPADANIKVSTHGDPISPEYILEKNPDYLFVVDRTAAVGGESSAKKTVENELVKKTNAFKDGHIVYLDPNYWYLSGGGLLSVAEMVKELDKGVK